jgi:CubicO group peptidase (beta-lactamase class C family)
MKLRIVNVVLPLAFFTLAGAAHAQQPEMEAQSARLDQIFERWNSPDSPGCAVGVSWKGSPPLERGYGMADLEHGAANTPATVFEAGSVSKQFTVAAIVLLAQRGKLSLDDDARIHVPELPVYEAPITLRHLIHHTSGLRDWGTVVSAAGWPRTSRVHTHQHVLDVASRQRSLNYSPGAEYSYTNTGYNLLAIIVERVSGQSFADFSREQIFEPLGMLQTQWRDDHTRVVKRRATAYTPRNGAFHMLMPFENVYGNGGLLTTVGDLLIWNENLERGTVGGRPLLDELHRKGVLSDGREIGYAGGLMIGLHRQVPEVSHGGATAGYRAFLARYPEQRLSVALLCNTTSADAGSLSRRTADVFLDVPAPAPATSPAATVAAPALNALAGLYRNARTNEPLRLTVANGRLRMMDRVDLVPLSAVEFRIGTTSERLRFHPISRGTRSFSMIDADGGVVEYHAVEPVQPPTDELNAYQGVYHSHEAEAEYSVRVVDGALLLELRPHVRTLLTPSYRDVFTTPQGSLVRFIRRADGSVAEMSFGMGRVRDLRFQRVAPR